MPDGRLLIRGSRAATSRPRSVVRRLPSLEEAAHPVPKAGLRRPVAGRPGRGGRGAVPERRAVAADGLLSVGDGGGASGHGGGAGRRRGDAAQLAPKTGVLLAQRRIVAAEFGG